MERLCLSRSFMFLGAMQRCLANPSFRPRPRMRRGWPRIRKCWRQRCVLHSVGPGVVLHSVGAVLYPVLGIGSGQPGRLHSRAGGTFGQLRLVVRWSRYRQAQTAPRRRQREYRQYYLSLFHNISTNRLFPPTLVWKMKKIECGERGMMLKGKQRAFAEWRAGALSWRQSHQSARSNDLHLAHFQIFSFLQIFRPFPISFHKLFLSARFCI